MDVLTKQVWKTLGKSVPNSGFDEETNMPEIYTRKIARQYGRHWKGGRKTRWVDAVNLYYADPKFWEKYYNGHRVSGFHPSHDRFLQGFPHLPEFRRALEARGAAAGAVAREPVGGNSGSASVQPSHLNGRDLRKHSKSDRLSRSRTQKQVGQGSHNRAAVSEGHSMALPTEELNGRTDLSMDPRQRYGRLRSEFGIRRFP